MFEIIATLVSFAMLLFIVGIFFIGRSTKKSELKEENERAYLIPKGVKADTPRGRGVQQEVEGDEPQRVVPPVERREMAGSLPRSRGLFGAAISRMKSKKSLSEEFWNELEEALILSDVGFEVSEKVVSEVRAQVTKGGVTSTSQAVNFLKEAMEHSLSPEKREINTSGPAPSVLLFVGVNGVGKTTTIGKLAARLSGEGQKVVVAAGDTFRAAATEQLEMWAERANVEMVRGTSGGDPASVIFDAISHASAISADIVLADTAGRIQNRTNLMEELKKIRRVAERASGTVTEVLLVLDATTGQNGLLQAKGFAEAAGITGVVLTKLDGTAKGGVAFAVESELSIPIKLIGVGESVGDLVVFDPVRFVEELVGSEESE